MTSLHQALLLALATAVLLAAVSGPALAQETSSERARRSHALATEVMSPYCPGRTLADCPSPSAGALRAEIRGLVDEGVRDEAILERLEARFGDAIVGVPRGTLGWILPGVILLAGAAILVAVLRRLSARQTAEESEAGDPEPEQELDRKLGL
jgi:cytochrome c-type biogenesis protein CcmH/NrfF